LTASDNGNRHDVLAALVEYLLELVEAARRSVVNRLPIEKAHELIEVGAEGNSRIVNKPPCRVEVRARNIGGVKTCPARQGAACADGGYNIFERFGNRRSRRVLGELDLSGLTENGRRNAQVI